MIKAGYETLVEAGYQPEVAYFVCLHEIKQIVDFIVEGGLANMRRNISSLAEYGDYTRGTRIVTNTTRVEMCKILNEIQTGQFAHEFVQENLSGKAVFKAMRNRETEHSIEKVGRVLRLMLKGDSARLTDN